MKSNKDRIRILILLCCILFLFSCNFKIFQVLNETENTSNPVITGLAKGSYCGIESKKEIVISSSKKWQDIWNEIYKESFPQPEIPEIDFTKETILAVFMGTRSTGGHSIEINSIKEYEGNLEVIVKTKSPEPGEMVTMAITRPFHVVKVNIVSENSDFIWK